MTTRTLRRPLPASATAIVTLIALIVFAGGAEAQTLTPPDTSAGCRWTLECSAAGTSLQMTELSRSGEARKTKVVVSPRVAGFPAGVPLTLWARRVGEQPKWVATGFAIDSSGKSVCADRAEHGPLATTAGSGWCRAPIDSIRLTVGDAMHGEPFEFAIATADGRTAAYAAVVPRPSIASVEGCGTVESRIIDADARAMLVVGHGFAPSRRFIAESMSASELVSGGVTADSTGRFTAIVNPGRPDARGGEATYSVRTGPCHVTLRYPWGRSAK